MIRRALLMLAVGAALSFSGAAFAQETSAEAKPSGPRVTLHTTKGAIVIALDPARAPKTVENFLRYVKSGYYKGAAIYRVEPGHVIQLGEYDAKMKYRAPKFPPVPLETATSAPHKRGAVAMARLSEPDSGLAAFFFDLGDNAHLNAKAGAAPNTSGYAVFGEVVEGMDVLDAIAGVELGGDGPFKGKAPKEAIVVEAVGVLAN